MTDVRIELAQAEQVSDVLRLFEAENELSGYAEAALADPLGSLFIAFDGKEVVGAVITRELLGPDRVRRGGIDELLVKSDHRMQGIGRALMAAAEEHWRRQEGIEGIQLTTASTNTVALRLYESLGYREVHRRVRMVKDW